jgi:hypothetical protein
VEQEHREGRAMAEKHTWKISGKARTEKILQLL